MRKPLWPVTTVVETEGVAGFWAPLVPPEKLAAMPPRLAKVVPILNAAVYELTGLLLLYEMALTLNDKAFMDSIAQQSCYVGVYTIIVSAYTNIYIKLPALFDDDARSVNLFRVVNAVLLEPERAAILRFHRNTSEAAYADALRMLMKLKLVRRRMKGGRFSEAIRHLTASRNQHFAHFDYQAGRIVPTLAVRDVQTCLLNAARLTDLSCRLILQRAYMLPEMRQLARARSVALRDTLARGATRS